MKHKKNGSEWQSRETKRFHQIGGSLAMIQYNRNMPNFVVCVCVCGGVPARANVCNVCSSTVFFCDFDIQFCLRFTFCVQPNDETSDLIRLVRFALVERRSNRFGLVWYGLVHLSGRTGWGGETCAHRWPLACVRVCWAKGNRKIMGREFGSGMFLRLLITIL